MEEKTGLNSCQRKNNLIMEIAMSSITQGTVISGVQSEKYKGINCCAIVINARCDLAQEKTNKIYYLIAMPLEEWMFSSIGIPMYCSNGLKNMTKYGIIYP